MYYTYFIHFRICTWHDLARHGTDMAPTWHDLAPTPQGRGIYDELLTLSQFSRSSEYSVVDEGGATRNGCWHRPGIKLARHGADMASKDLY